MKKKVKKFDLSKKDKENIFIKGLKKGSREAEKERGGHFKGGPHKNKKKYSRKEKHKGRDY